ncbi:MAG: DUF4328 domain-containing protein [Pyrinomonadaceae bacterium]
MATQFYAYGYRSGHVRALAAMLLLGACAGVHFLSAILNGFLAGGVLGGPSAAGSGEETLSVAAALHTVMLLLTFLVYFATVVAFLLWLHRAYSNLRPLGAKQLNTSPGWAVGFFFIPFANLVKPYQAVREVWRWSKPVSAGDGVIEGLSFTTDSSAPLVGWWWGLWLTSSVAGNLYYRLSDETGMEDAAPWLGLLNDVMTIIAAALAILMIHSIDRMQTERSQQLNLSNMMFEQPPPPPTFGVSPPKFS